jgi:hypothetical protein
VYYHWFKVNFYVISGSLAGEYEDDILLGYRVMNHPDDGGGMHL